MNFGNDDMAVRLQQQTMQMQQVGQVCVLQLKGFSLHITCIDETISAV